MNDSANNKSAGLRQLAEDFIRQIYEGGCISVIPFCQNCWFSGAYSTIRRTLHGEFDSLKGQTLSECRDALFEGIANLGTGEFDPRLRTLIETVASDFGISIGHGQKLVSILLKYAFAATVLDDPNTPKPIGNVVLHHRSNLPVPIDAGVLYQLKSRYKDQFGDVRGYRTQDADGEFGHTASIKLPDKRWVSWSRLDNYGIYWSLQTRIRKIAKSISMDPLEFEMRFLWPSLRASP
jgi:hypothetical protein